eukprot:TRINITY_DN4451_c0_g2_i2.p1 TRINITY_DN4451_c0_g2~~TRINITY_DN4451_c0_g2_i2.p1  ORF type:complete len:101 (+),score=11.92 TRINITY_DN4451_c0_g2_i2:362-664(+)
MLLPFCPHLSHLALELIFLLINLPTNNNFVFYRRLPHPTLLSHLPNHQPYNIDFTTQIVGVEMRGVGVQRKRTKRGSIQISTQLLPTIHQGLASDDKVGL